MEITADQDINKVPELSDRDVARILKFEQKFLDVFEGINYVESAWIDENNRPPISHFKFLYEMTIGHLCKKNFNSLALDLRCNFLIIGICVITWFFHKILIGNSAVNLANVSSEPQGRARQ